MTSNAQPPRFQSFAAFYPFYLGEHRNPTCRALHFVGSTLVLMLLVWVLITQNWWLGILIPIAGYGFAWVGHFFFEKNRPATFSYPAWSFMGDWVMYSQLLRGKIGFAPRADELPFTSAVPPAVMTDPAASDKVRA
jgi:hypothetical protein